MSKKNTSKEDWPKINSIVAINAGTRIDCGRGRIAIVPSYDEEIFGIVVEHHPQVDSRHDWIDILVEDQVYHVLRTPSPHIDIPPYFNLREIHDDGTSTKF